MKPYQMILGLMLTVLMLTSCASNRQTYKQTTITRPAAADTISDSESGETSTVTKETTVATTETTQHDHGILGGIVHVIGQVIAFPFKLIGGVLEAIF